MNKTWPTLYSKGKLGKVSCWTVQVCGNKIITTWGEVGGKQVSTEREVEGKNLGRANATTAEAQALKEAEADWTAKKTRKYVESPSGERTVFLPMLAKNWDPRHVKYPGYVQPKLDGVRAIATVTDEGVEITSRTGRTWNTIQYISNELKEHFPPGTILDGELYRHGLTFQEITRLAKKDRGVEELRYCVFDVIDPEMTLEFHERLTLLQSFPFDKLTFIDFVPTIKVSGLEEVKTLEERFLSEGYEGVMYRNSCGKYLPTYRSDDLMKLKRFEDAEFEIIDVVEGIGSMKGKGILVCRAENGEPFEVSIATTMEERARIWEERHSVIGRSATVRFLGRTESGFPKVAVAKGVRLEEDL